MMMMKMMMIMSVILPFPSRLGPEKGLKALPKLWELLPGLHNLQHLE